MYIIFVLSCMPMLGPCWHAGSKKHLHGTTCFTLHARLVSSWRPHRLLRWRLMTEKATMSRMMREVTVPQLRVCLKRYVLTMLSLRLPAPSQSVDYWLDMSGELG